MFGRHKISDFVKQLRRWPLIKVVALLLVSLCLYAIGIKFVLVIMLISASAYLLPLPRLFQSLVGRVFVGVLVAMSMLQVAATFQFLLFPKSNFVVLAALAVVLQVALLAVAPRPEQITKLRFMTVSDVCALIVATVFLLPFTPIFAGRDSIFKIAEIGSIQAIDATNHYAGIAEVTEAQHLTYAPGYYYPKGFHIATGFIEESIIGQQASLGWRGNAITYFLQYVLWGVLLAYAFFALSVAFLGRMRKSILPRSVHFLLAACLAPIAALFYLLPLVNEGFLNYYYVLTTIFAGLVFLLEFKDQVILDPERLLKDATSRWLILMYLVLIFGASVSWPLLIPPLVLVGIVAAVSDRLNIVRLVRQIWSASCVPIIVAFVLQLIPIYFQLTYSGADASQGINLTGGLKEFHALVLLAGIALVIGVVLSKVLDDAYKRLILTIFMPLTLFIALLVLMQYFVVGEIRYYVIKSSWLLEMMLVAFGVALFVHVLETARLVVGKFVLFLPVIPLAIMLLLVSVLTNPLKDVRDIFRNYSHEDKPAFFDHDVSVYAKLGSAGTIKHFNSTLLHYNQQQGKFYAHEQLTYWSNMMQYDASAQDFLALNCAGALYSNVAFGNFTPPEQQALVAKVKECAADAKAHNQDYYIITDADSAPMLRAAFGDLVKLAY